MAAPIYRGGPPFNGAYFRFKNQIVAPLQGSGAPTDGVTGAGFAGPGSLYVRRSNGAWYINTNTAVSPTWTLVGTVASDSITTAMLQALSVTTAKLGANAVTSGKIDETVLQVATGSISSANITGTSAGQLGHANGVVLVAPQGTHKVVQLVSASIAYQFGTAAYTGGGNITVNNAAGGAALSGLVSFANSVGAASSKVLQFVPLATAAIVGVENGGLNLVSASAPTQPGTAAGIINWSVSYRIFNTGL